VTQERKKRKKIEKNLPENTGAGPALEEGGGGEGAKAAYDRA
jgi:hypothetical protein